MKRKKTPAPCPKLLSAMVDAEWVADDLRRMELCAEIGTKAAERRFNEFRQHVASNLAKLRTPPSWKAERRLYRNWKERGIVRDTTPEHLVEDRQDIYQLCELGFSLFYATQEMYLCREIGGNTAKKRYEECAAVVERILGRKPLAWQEAREDYLATERMYKELVKAAKKHWTKEKREGKELTPFPPGPID